MFKHDLFFLFYSILVLPTVEIIVLRCVEYGINCITLGSGPKTLNGKFMYMRSEHTKRL